MIERLKLSHHYTGSYFQPNDLWTPEEIIEEGFIFVPCLTFIHQFNDPNHPIMQAYIGYGNDLDPKDLNLRPVIIKTSRFCEAGYTKTNDLDAGRWRGIESVQDYFNKKDIFKPQILEWMRKRECHYVYKVSLEDSPCIWEENFGKSKMYFHKHAVYIRSCKLPKKL